MLEATALYPLDVRLTRYLVTARREPRELDFPQLIGASRKKIDLAPSMLERVCALRQTRDRLFLRSRAARRNRLVP